MSATSFIATLQESRMISPKVKHFVFHHDLPGPFDYIPGQFVTIHFEHEGKPLKRSYSIANEPRTNNLIELAAGYIENGPGTKFLYQLTPGDKVTMSGPFGRLILREELPKRYILVATSTGITPYRAMLPELTRRMVQQPNLRVVILQGVQKREEILYADEFQAFVQQYPQAEFRPCLSRQPSEALLAHEFKGYAQHAFPALDLNPAQDLVYLCGNPGMIDDAFSYLKEHGFAMQHIIREKYISR